MSPRWSREPPTFPRSRLAGFVTVAAALACAGEAPMVTRSGTTSAGVYYEVTGAGPPVVLIHGFSLDRRMWNAQVDAFADEFRVVTYDLRGHGKSVAPTTPYASVDDLRAVLDTLGLERASLVGLSAGAQIATDFALVHPNRVERLVLAGPGLSGYVPKEPFTWFAPVAEAVRAGDVTLAAERWAETPLMRVEGDRAAAQVRAMVLENARLWSYRNEDRPLSPPAVKRLAELVVPVLVLVGADDLPNILGVADTLATCVVGARRVILPNVRHIVNLDAPAAFNEIVLPFLRGDASAMPSTQERDSPCAR